MKELSRIASAVQASTTMAIDAMFKQMKADGVEYEERMERIAEVTYPRPLEDLLAAAECLREALKVYPGRKTTR